jgi:hypothetical protein
VEDVRDWHDHVSRSQIAGVTYAHDMTTPASTRIYLLAEVPLALVGSQDQHLIPWCQIGQDGVQVLL